MCRLRIAFAQRTSKEPGYVDVVCFGTLAHTCATYLRKGRQVGVTGRLTYHEWMPPGTSLPERRLSIVVSSVDWLGRPENPGEPVTEEGDDVPISERPLSPLRELSRRTVR